MAYPHIYFPGMIAVWYARWNDRYCCKSRFVVGEGCVLVRIADADNIVRNSKPQEYTPGKGVYIDDYDDETILHLRESKQRMGGRDLHWEIMVRDSCCCRRCGRLVDYSTAHIDHIIPVKRFASFRQAHTLDNLQTLAIIFFYKANLGASSDAPNFTYNRLEGVRNNRIMLLFALKFTPE